MCEVGHAGACRAYLSAMRCLIGSHTLSTPVSINRMCGANSFIGAPRPTVSTQPGNCRTFLGDDSVSYCLNFLSDLVFTIVPFPILNVNDSGFILKQRDRHTAYRSRDGLFYS